MTILTCFISEVASTITPSASNISWTDIAQAITAIIGVPLTFITLYKLVKKDKEREAEIASLAVIANELKNSQQESEKRYRNSKKPHIIINIESRPNRDGGILEFIFENTNPTSCIVSFLILETPQGFKNFITTVIHQIGNKQRFKVLFIYQGTGPSITDVNIKYTTEEAYVFVQNIAVFIEDNTYKIAPSAIIANHN